MRGLIYLESLSLIVSSFSAFLVHCLMGVDEIPNTKFQFLPLSLVVWFLGGCFGYLGLWECSGYLILGE